ncbi:MAG: isochorismatase family protein [Muribaculaceae bacterium]|nr:isochorismatase family protein [Muribaculaceae bacterium]
MSNKMLLIIDPQIDFISGSLPVPDAEPAMNQLACYVDDHQTDYNCIIITADSHPMRHCSFKSEGGQWPRHCIADSVGSAIWPPLMDALLKYPDKVEILHKGVSSDREEYSIFKNLESKERLLELISRNKIDEIDICGLAGDVCVADTIRDAIEIHIPARISVLTRFTPSLDGGATLDSLIKTPLIFV